MGIKLASLLIVLMSSCFAGTASATAMDDLIESAVADQLAVRLANNVSSEYIIVQLIAHSKASLTPQEQAWFANGVGLGHAVYEREYPFGTYCISQALSMLDMLGMDPKEIESTCNILNDCIASRVYRSESSYPEGGRLAGPPSYTLSIILGESTELHNISYPSPGDYAAASLENFGLFVPAEDANDPRFIIPVARSLALMGQLLCQKEDNPGWFFTNGRWLYFEGEANSSQNQSDPFADGRVWTMTLQAENYGDHTYWHDSWIPYGDVVITVNDKWIRTYCLLRMD